MIKDIKNDFEREVYIKYITYMEIPDCAESYDMFFRDMMKIYNKNNSLVFLNELYTPQDVEDSRQSSINVSFKIVNVIKALDDKLKQYV